MPEYHIYTKAKKRRGEREYLRKLVTISLPPDPSLPFNLAEDSADITAIELAIKMFGDRVKRIHRVETVERLIELEL